ncbi:MAG: response regulator [Deltaproteobacteria bacterium]|nr:response regulator [Deltaproteobacteria bacterium]
MDTESYRILLVEDEPVIQELVSSMLGGEIRGRNVELRVVANGAEAVPAAKRMLPDLVLLDIVLPSLDGIAVCRLINADPALGHTRVCMLTARASARDHQDAEAAGADAYVEKPFKGMDLIELVENLLTGEAFR